MNADNRDATDSDEPLVAASTRFVGSRDAATTPVSPRDWDIDVYAMANPALGCAVLWSFLRGAEEAGGALEMPLLFLPIPLALSDEVARTIARGNRTTGFFGWLDRNPDVTSGLSLRVQRTVSYSRSALLYGGQARVLSASADGRFHATTALSQARLDKAAPPVRRIFSLARRLGYWIGEVGSTADVLYALGITV